MNTNLFEAIGFAILLPALGYYLIEHTVHVRTDAQQMLLVGLVVLGSAIYAIRRA